MATTSRLQANPVGMGYSGATGNIYMDELETIENVEPYDKAAPEIQMDTQFKITQRRAMEESQSKKV